MVITTAQLHSTKPEFKFWAGSSPARGVSGICDGEDLWQWSQLEIKINAFRWSAIPQKHFIIIIIIIRHLFAPCQTCYMKLFVQTSAILAKSSSFNSSVIRQKGESQNRCFKKKSSPKFPKSEHFLPCDTHTYVLKLLIL